MKSFMQQLAKIIGSFFYVGYIPKAPGTMGSLAAIPLAWWVWTLPTPYAAAFIVALFVVGTWAAHEMIKMTGTEDHQTIVVDEVVGILVTTAVATHLWWQYALAFCFFRLFDILKPGPVGLVDSRVKGGFGTMADDLVAAIMAAVMLYIVLMASAYMMAPAA